MIITSPFKNHKSGANYVNEQTTQPNNAIRPSNISPLLLLQTAQCYLAKPSKDGSWTLDHLIMSLQVWKISLYILITKAQTKSLLMMAHFQITHKDSTKISSPTISYSLSNVSCVPDVSKNLIYVSKFCKTNQTFVEIFPYLFLAKDLGTGRLSHKA